MAKTPERKVKDQVTGILKSLGVYYFFPVTGGYGSSGVPDIICCYKGRFIGIECKAGGNKLTALQQSNIGRINEAGGVTLVIDESWTTGMVMGAILMAGEINDA